MNQNNNTKIQQIKKLPDFLINQIAAGEVVERPASVLKELLENSIDANSTKISIELSQGGKKLIKVIDNGYGLTQENFNLVFERHATSKIQTLEDLNNNLHLGFRGEALAAIASVSKIEFASNGFSINSDGELKPKSMPHGTQLTVEDLFYNIPARQKFLKTDSTEYKKCLEVIESYALCHHNVSFKLVHNQKPVFDYPQTPTPSARITAILGQEVNSKLFPINYQSQDIILEGFIGRPELAKERMPDQYIFVNGRPLDAPYFNHAVKNAFGSLIFPAENPLFLLWITLNPKDVDMNVHPRKLEARFHFQGIIYNTILKTIKSTLEKNSLEKTVQLSKESYQNFIPKTYSQPTYDFSGFQNIPRTQRSTSVSTHKDKPPAPTLTPLCQIAESYILCQSQDGILLIDQHAAHERVMYQKLKTARQNQLQNQQPLLVPLRIELSPSQLEIFKATSTILTSIGFDIADFGSNSIVINAIPTKFSNNNIDQLIQGLLSDLEQGVDFSHLEQIEDIVINFAACRGAIKFGQKLSHLEMEALISEMEQIQDKQYSCPHGRPTMITITFDELEKQFKRK